MALVQTATRVARNTSPVLNRRILEDAQRNLDRYARADGAAIAARLQELRKEWDVERAIEIETPLTILAGIALGAFVDRRLLALSGFAAGMLLLHNVQGWHPLLPVLRRKGMRTSREIADEAYALKRRRGDFDALGAGGGAQERAARAYQAAAWT